MKLVVLGCASVPQPSDPASARRAPGTPSALAIGEHGGHWVLINASPDVAQQLRATPALQPKTGAPRFPIRTVILTDAQLEHVTGLLSLREGPRLHVHATPAVFEDLSQSLPLLPALEPHCGVCWHLLPVAGDTHEARFQVAELPQLQFTAVALGGPAARYSSRHHDPSAGERIALHIEDVESGQSLFVAPAAQAGQPGARRWMDRADCLLVDDMIAPDAALGLEWIGTLRSRRKVLFPSEGPSRLQRSPDWLARHGLELAHEGMEIEL